MTAADARARAIEAGALAFRDYMGFLIATEFTRLKVASVLDAVEPIIRADERRHSDEQCSREVHRLNSELDAAQERLADLRAKYLRAKVEGLTPPYAGAGYATALRDVLALLDEVQP